MKKGVWGSFLVCVVILHAISMASATLVSEGRALLFDNGGSTYANLVAANEKFRSAVQQNPNSDEANFFYAVTQVPASFFTTGTSPSVIETGRELLEAFGFTLISGAGYGYDPIEDSCYADDPYGEPLVNGELQFPAGAPNGEAVRQFFRGPFLDTLDSAIFNLNSVSSSFRTFLTASETGTDSLEIDYGDVLVYKSLLLSLKTGILILTAHNTNVDLVTLSRNWEEFRIQRDLFDEYPDFLKLLPSGGISEDGAAMLQQARDALIQAIDAYTAASNFVRNETDNQLDDLFSIASEDLSDEAHFRDMLLEAKASLLQGRMASFESLDGTEIDHVNLNHLFGYPGIDPLDARDIAPMFDAQNFIRTGGFPDTTLGGTLPDCNTEAKLMEFFDGELPVVFPITRATIAMNGYESDWTNVPAIESSYFEYDDGNQDIECIKVAKDSTYLYWMIRFASSPSTYVNYHFSLGWNDKFGIRHSMQAQIDESGEYTIWAWPADQQISGDSNDFGVEQIVEGRIPIKLLDSQAVFDVYVSGSNWNLGYHSYLSGDELITTFPVTSVDVPPLIQLLLEE